MNIQLLIPVLACIWLAQDISIAQEQKKSKVPDEFTSLFNGESLEGWTVSQFGGQDRVEVIDGAIVMEMGYPLVGITYDKKWDHKHFEIALEAKAIDGNDFFCCLTFPVDDQFCSFVVGGWAGSITGLSCIDMKDASDNETTTHKVYDKDRWYKIVVRVTASRITCSIDDEKVVDVIRDGKEFSLRPEVLASKPLGICSFETKAALRNIRVRKIK